MQATLKTVKKRKVHFFNAKFIAKVGFSEAIKTNNSEIKLKLISFSRVSVGIEFGINGINRQKKAGQRSTKVEFDKSSY